MAGRILICCLFFLISSSFGRIEERWIGSATPNPHDGANDGSSFKWRMVNKISAAQETNLQNSQTVELTNLKAWTDECVTGTQNCNRDSDANASPAADMVSCGKSQWNAFKDITDYPYYTPNSWAIHYLLYTPTADIQLMVDLTKYGLQQTYSPKMFIFSYKNANWTDINRTPADVSGSFSSSMYCHALVLDVCENSTMPVAYTFFKGNTYLFQIFAFGLPTSGGQTPSTTVGNFYLGLIPAKQIWIETFNSVDLGSLPSGWIASINATSAPTRQPNSTWVVGDVDYLSTDYINGNQGVDGRYVADNMQPSGGVTLLGRFLGVNPSIFCNPNDAIPCKRVNEYLISTAIDLTAYTHLEFQFSSVLDNNYRPPTTGGVTQGSADWYVTVLFSYDRSSWNTLIGGNFPVVSTQTENPSLWLTYQYNADVLAGRIVYLKFNFNMIAFTSSRVFGIDNLRFVDTGAHKLCTFPYACGIPTCNISSSYLVNKANNQGYYGCGYATNDTVCSVNNNQCTDSQCQPDSPSHDALGCTVTTNVSKCTDGASCETATCSAASGCVYQQHDNLCVNATSSLCADYWCDTTAHKGCQVSYSNNFTAPSHNRDPSSICDDSASCSTDVCEPLPTSATVDSNGCSHTVIPNTCATGDSSNPFGNSQCVTSVCDPVRSKTGANAFDDSVSKTGCFSELNVSMCTDYSTDCETHQCLFHSGCQYTQDDTKCTAASSCITPTCVHGATKGCDYSDNTTKLNAGTACSAHSSCQIPSCKDDAKATDGCHYFSDNNYCQMLTTNCTNAVCNGFSGCDFSSVNNAVCSDGFACTINTCQNSYTDPTGSHPALSSGCTTTYDNTQCTLSTAGSTCATSTCNPSSTNTGSLGCFVEEHDNLCTGDVPCSKGKCSSSTGCAYLANDTLCSTDFYPGTLPAPTCNIYKCYTLNKQAGDDTYEWSHKDSNGCYIKPNCADSFDCTVDTCESDSTCKHTPDDSRCKQSRGCTLNTCEPNDPSSDADGCHYVVRCDDEIDCTIDECVNTTAGRDKCLHTIDMTLCDDGVDCTYELLCDVKAGATKVGPIVKQYDNITGCIRVPMNEWCDDSNPCTIDVCQPTNTTTKGGCVHYDIDCDDGIPCTLDTCDILTGTCKHTDKPGYCDDDIACTVDKCDRVLAMCTNVPDDTVCGAFAPNKCVDTYCRPSLVADSTGCFFLDKSCNDGIACTDDTCDPLTGACSHNANNLYCDDGGECTEDTCDVVLGKCTNIPNSNLCNDGLACTVDFCDCETGNCVHTFVDCSDEIACTIDSCDEANGGQCTHTVNHTVCDDGVLCTTDYCDAQLGKCVNIKSDQYCVDNAADKSFDWFCEPPTTVTTYYVSGCVNYTKNCDDSIVCTEDYADPITGACFHVPNITKCDDTSECNDVTCSASLGCISKPNDNKCNDNMNCTIDICGRNGSCQHNLLYCNDEVGCTDDRCDELSGGVCVFVPNNASCDDSIDCTQDICDGKQCLNIPMDELCTFEESECSFGVCSIAYGGCQYELHDELCNDRLQCTLDYCDGVNGCAHAPQDGLCDDNIPCTSDRCDVNVGCVHETHDEWCVDNVTCTSNICDSKMGCQFIPQSSLCNDNLDCTIDTCDVKLDCVFTPDDSVCTDSISCTLDKCDTTLGMCTNTPMNNYCTDDFVCTNETCDPNATPGTTGCFIDTSKCPWASPELLYISSTSAYAHIIEERGSDGSGSSLKIVTKDENGDMSERMVVTADNKVIFGANRMDTYLSEKDGVVIVPPLRLVPVTEDSLGECNEIRRGTIRVVDSTTTCGDRNCNKDILKVCVLEDTYYWKEVQISDS